MATHSTQFKISTQLSRALESGDLVICTGPALATAAGLPGIEALAAQILGEARRQGWTLPPGLDAAIAAGRGDEVLTELMRELGQSFGDQVERVLSDRGRSVPDLARAIASLRTQLRAVLTTTPDRLIERAFEGRWPTFSTPRADLAQRSGIIFNVFGTLEFRNSWVLTHRQRLREFGDGALRRGVLETVYYARRLLLLAFDLEDPALRRFLGVLPKPADDQAPQHFIAAEHCSPAQRRWLASHGFTVVEADALALLQGLGATTTAVTSQGAKGCPYPGLEAFVEASAATFFGRHGEISQAASRLGGTRTSCHWLAVEGPSGVGKSSFVHAGIVPALHDGFAPTAPTRWTIARMRPGARPLRSLAEALTSSLGSGDEPTTETAANRLLDPLISELAARPTKLAELVEQHSSPGGGFLLVIDQLEEAVTFADPRESEALSLALAHALSTQAIYLVTTLRSDYVALVQARLPTLAELLNEGAERYALPPISRVGLREAITEPAARVGVHIEPALVERIIADADYRSESVDGEEGVRTGQGTLPLVANILRVLWEAGGAEDRVLTLEQYVRAGGVSGALSRTADAALAGLAPHQLAAAKSLFLGLVRIEGGGETRCSLELPEALTLAGGGPEAEDLLAHLSGQTSNVRLLTVRQEGELTFVDLVHEALLQGWAQLRGWIDHHRRQLLLENALDLSAQRWDEDGRKNASLPAGDALVELLHARPHGPRRRLHQTFQQTLERQQRVGERQATRRRMAWFAGLSLFSLVSIATALGFRAQLDELGRVNAELVAKDSELETKDSELETKYSELETKDSELETKDKQLDTTSSELVQTSEKLRIVNQLLSTTTSFSLASLAALDPAELDRVRRQLDDHLGFALARLDEEPTNAAQQRAVRKLLASLAAVEISAKNTTRAQEYLDQVRALLESDDVGPGQRLQELANLELLAGELAAADNDKAGALEHYRAALEHLEEIGTQALSDEYLPLLKQLEHATASMRPSKVVKTLQPSAIGCRCPTETMISLNSDTRVRPPRNVPAGSGKHPIGWQSHGKTLKDQ
ncbi:MAG: hypothetical protein KC457_15460 [Myxococcales bacterium]|nr:hypothetical protein [Myxococcales bacterium]